MSNFVWFGSWLHQQYVFMYFIYFCTTHITYKNRNTQMEFLFSQGSYGWILGNAWFLMSCFSRFEKCLDFEESAWNCLHFLDNKSLYDWIFFLVRRKRRIAGSLTAWLIPLSLLVLLGVKRRSLRVTQRHWLVSKNILYVNKCLLCIWWAYWRCVQVTG